MIRSLYRSAVLVLLLATFGCGPSLNQVTGTVTMDGSPVPGAMVTFVSDDGNFSYSGMTNETGTFELSNAGTKGAKAGNYKVLVVKTPGTASGGGDVGNKDYMKDMQERMAKQPTGPSMPKGGPPKGGMMMPAGMMPPGGGSTAPPPKSELPAIYMSATTTTLKATIPSSGPIALVLEDKKDPKPKK